MCTLDHGRPCTMISSLPRVCHRAGTCRDSGGSTLSSRRLWRSMTADSKTSPLSLGTFRPSLPAWRSGSGRSGRRGTPSAPRRARIWRRWRSRRPEAPGIAFNGSVTFSATRRSSLVSSRFRSICMMLEGLADFVASAPSGFLHSLAALSRSAAADTHVPRAMAVLWSSYAR